MAGWQSGHVEANDLRMHYYRTGGEKPPVVLAHGFSDDGLCWTPVAEALAPEYDVVMVDARGHGQSEAPEQGYGPTEHAADLAGVIAALGLQRPAVLGHSMGAATTLMLAGTYPDVPRAILCWADRRGWDVRITGVDRHPVTAHTATVDGPPDPRLTIVQADAFDLPFEAGSFDYAMTSMFLHHLGAQG